MKVFAATTAGVTVGTVSWNVTYEDPSDSGIDVFAELYDANGNVKYSRTVPCKPPYACPLVTDNVAQGSYTAGLAVGAARYYYNENLGIISAPNDSAQATIILINSANLNPQIVIHVQP